MKLRLQGLPEIEAAVWAELQRCTQVHEHAWRAMVLATVDEQGAPDARTVIVRECDAAARELVFYTDARSPKAAALRREPRACLVAWSRVLGWQLRLHVRVDIETDGLAVSSRWARLKLTPAAQDYLSPLAPGSALDAPSAAPALENRDHFAVAHALVQAIDWTELHADGHRRARFEAGAARWLQP